ncbi:hypothetical protein, partial [Mesorhizobium sp. M4B.F.Ca.ET.211.01.1.1]|uniref:hypothetical protein n=1 Tax=Mesorhizobium sp. M4B.F.Ca.ET.211.01.1.1 TaxID=2563954 RepID=UPI001FE019C4
MMTKKGHPLPTPEQLAARWARFGGAVTELIVELGKVWGDPAAARRAQYQLEQMLLDIDDLAAPRRLARTLGIRGRHVRGVLELELSRKF